MSVTLKPGLRSATSEMAQIIAKAAQLRPTWLLDVRTVLGLQQAKMAALLGAKRRTYQRWEKNPRAMCVVAYRRAELLLEEANLTSQGKIRVA